MMMENATPAMRQYLDIKARHKDAILFFRMGDFYEMFYEDAILGSRLMGVALTSRDKEKKIPMCGVPYHAATAYISKLVKEGYKVAVCEQTEDASEAKGLVERAVTRIVTPGTALEDEFLDAKKSNYIASLLSEDGCVGFAFMDVSTGEFMFADFTDHLSAGEELLKINPAEVLMPEGQTLNGFAGFRSVSYLPANSFSVSAALGVLKSHFGVASMEGFGSEDSSLSVKAAGALLHYVKETQKTTLRHVAGCSRYSYENYARIDASTRRNLEITENSRSLEKKGSLLAHLDRTSTAMGGRLLRSWLLFPLMDEEAIKGRLCAVGELMEERALGSRLVDALKRCYDLERLTGRISVGLATPRDLVALRYSLEAAKEVKAVSSCFNSKLLSGLSTELDVIEEATTLISRAIADTPPATTRDGGFIKDGYSAELDELRRIGSGGKEWISELEASERKKTGINSLKVGYNRVFGYYIELTRAGLKNNEAPHDYIRKQTLANAERYITPELKEWESKILTAEEKGRRIELELFSSLLKELSAYSSRILRSAGIIASLDVLSSYADVSADCNYSKPDIRCDGVISIEDGRHPVLERNVADGFVPNDTLLDNAENQIMILTGPNMAGKSTFIRQVAVITLMAQAGCFVPAKKASIGIVDRIFTRVGASDDMGKGQSTFMVEMNETANILNNATSRSLVVLDEIGRGTSTFDGLSIAWAVVEYLHDAKHVNPKTLFATHYHELTELTLTKERVKNYNMAVKEWDDRVIFLRRVVPGGASRSYGIQVARLAGLPVSVIERANEILRNLESGELNESGMPKIAGHKSGTAGKTMDAKQKNLPLFAVETDTIARCLKEIDVNKLTPVDALNELVKLKRMTGE